jgi:hypothetical protein
MSERFGEWDVEDNGLMSRDGISDWPIFDGKTGMPTGDHARYFMVDRDRGLVRAVTVKAGPKITITHYE